jgi:hypothetical protein
VSDERAQVTRIVGRPFAKGFDPRRAIGRGGPVKAPIRRWSQQALNDPAVRRAILRVLRDPESLAFASTLRVMLSYAYGLPRQQVEVTGLAAVALKIEALPAEELQRLLTAPDEELAALLPGEDAADDD